MISETKTENASQRPTNILLKYQIGMFCLCYFAWVTVHIQREFWAMSKKNIKVQHPELTKTFFGAIDTSLFFTYALAQFFTGAIGDMYPQRLVLSISFTIQAVLFFFVGVGGSYEIFHLWWFGSLFALIGLIQSVDFPCLIGTIGQWTNKQTRGMVTGTWSTCSPVGNIIGLQLSVIILNFQGNHWEYQMYYITLGYFVVAALIYFFFLASPAEVGLQVQSEVIVRDDDYQVASPVKDVENYRETESNLEESQRIDFVAAIKAPYVVLYGFCFFCVKFSVYAVLLWMPMYLKETHSFNNQKIANVQSLYEIGTICGTIALGFQSDKNHNSRRSPTAIASISTAFLISLTFVVFYNNYPQTLWLISMFFFGFFLGSIHHMICCTVAADLGRSHSKQATSTITGIIDGIGSMGNGLGQIFLGGLIQNFGWRFGFLLPISIAIGCTLIPLFRIYFNEKIEIERINSVQIQKAAESKQAVIEPLNH